MVGVLATWLLVGLGIVGWGLAVGRLAKLQSSSVFYLFWIGWAAIIGFLQIWNLFLPVNSLAMTTVLVVGGGGLLLHRHWLGKQFRDATSNLGRRQTITIVVIGGFAIFWSNLALGLPEHPDSFLYHIATVWWVADYPTTPGLANLHSRFGYNNASFLYNAMFECGPWRRQSHHYGGGLLSLVAMTQLLTMALANNWKRPSVRSLFAMVMVPAVMLATCKDAAGYGPDAVIFILGVVLTLAILELAEHNVLAEMKQRYFLLLTIGLVAAVGVTVKLNFVVFGFASVVTACYLTWGKSWFSRISQVETRLKSAAVTNEPKPWRAASVTLLVVLVIMSGWMIRGVYLSGYVAFPLSIGAVDTPWRLPVEEVTAHREEIKGYARDWRNAREALHGYHWVGHWIKFQGLRFLSVMLPCALVLVGLATFATTRLRGIATKRHFGTFAAVSIAPLFTLAAVLVQAPDLRFAGASLWVLASGALAMSLAEFAPTTFEYRLRWRMFSIFVVVLLAGITAKSLRHATWKSDGLVAIPIGPYQQVESDHGVLVNVIGRFPEENGWTAPLPASSIAQPGLQQRDPNNVAAGYVIAPVVTPKKNPAAELATPPGAKVQR